MAPSVAFYCTSLSTEEAPHLFLFLLHMLSADVPAFHYFVLLPIYRIKNLSVESVFESV